MTKTSRSLFWIDSAELGALARLAVEPTLVSEPRLRTESPSSAPERQPMESSQSPARTLQVEMHAAAGTSPAAGSSEQRLDPGAAAAPPPEAAAGPAEEVLPVFSLPEGGLEERLKGLLSWLEVLGITDSFVTDHEGLPLVQRGTSEAMAAASSALSNLWGSLNASLFVPAESSLEVAFAGAGRLYVIPITTERNRLALGFETSTPLTSTATEAIRAAFASAVAETSTETTP